MQSLGVEGMSASKLRVGTVKGDFETFRKGVPKGPWMMKELKNWHHPKSMGVKEKEVQKEMWKINLSLIGRT